MYKYEVKEFSSTYHLIDSIALLDVNITNTDRETIRIFFRTYTEPPEEDTDDSENTDDSVDSANRNML